MTDFARLEVHDGLQVLAFIEEREHGEGQYGPCLITRCDPSISVSTTAGWDDNEEGWDKAEKALADLDLAEFAKSAKAMVAKFTA